MGDLKPEQPSDAPIQQASLRGRSVGQKMALFLVPLLALFLFLMGASAFIRAAAVLQDSSLAELFMVSRTVLNRIGTWSESREIWLHQADNSELSSSLISYMNDPVEENRQALLNTLERAKFYQNEEFFSDIAVISIDGTVLLATNSAWETTAPPSFIGLPADQISSMLHFDEPVIAPGGLTFISSLPVNISDDQSANILLLGVCIDNAVSNLLSELQLSAESTLPRSLQAASVYLAFRPGQLVPVRIPGGTAEVQIGSTHPAFTESQGSYQGTYRNDSGVVLSAASWQQDGIGIILDIPLLSGLQNLIGLGLFLAVLVFIGVLLSSIAVILASKQLLKPLQELVGYAQYISLGNWNQRLDESGNDEFGALARTFNQMVSRLTSLYQSLEARVEERTRQIRTASEVARTATASPSLEDLLQRSVNLIADRFGYNSVSIFLLQPGTGTAILKESSSDSGKALIARAFQVEINNESNIGWAAGATQIHLSRNIRSDPLHLSEHLLPETRAEAALPLEFGGRILGVLDIQSTSENAFQSEDIEILSTLADELSAAIHNASLAQASATIAARARLITEITGKLSGVLDIDQVLETTAEALHNALGKPEVLVKISSTAELRKESEPGIVYDQSAETLQSQLPGTEKKARRKEET